MEEEISDTRNRENFEMHDVKVAVKEEVQLEETKNGPKQRLLITGI